MKNVKTSHQLASRFFQGDKKISLRDIEKQVAFEEFEENVRKYSFGKFWLSIPVSIFFILKIALG